MGDRKRERERQRHRQREKQAPCKKPNVGLDPRTLGSQHKPKADAQPLSYPGWPDAVRLLTNFSKRHRSTDPGSSAARPCLDSGLYQRLNT